MLPENPRLYPAGTIAAEGTLQMVGSPPPSRAAQVIEELLSVDADDRALALEARPVGGVSSVAEGGLSLLATLVLIASVVPLALSFRLTLFRKVLTPPSAAR